jgi:hypothetical protein
MNRGGESLPVFSMRKEMKKILVILALLLAPSFAFAQVTVNDLMGSGMAAQLAANVLRIPSENEHEKLIMNDSTAASACVGSGTLTAATPLVISTTCINTGDYVFLTRTSLDTDGTGKEYAHTIVNGVSFSVTSVANDTATFNWFIVKGQ